MKTLFRNIKFFTASNHPQIAFVIITAGLAALLLIIWLSEHNLFSVKDYTSSSYLLSAVVQSLAAMLAIVLTLTMVSIQLAAQFLSYRIIRIYISKPIPIMIFFIYVLSILFNSLMLSRSDWMHFEHNVLQINFGVTLFFACILYLVPYTLYFVSLLEPLNTITAFMKKVGKDDIVSYPEVVVYGKRLGEFVVLPRMSYNEDPFQPVFEILDLSLSKKSSDTIRCIVMSFRKRILQMLEVSDSEEESLKITFYFCEHIKNIKEKALRYLPESSIIVEIFDSLSDVAKMNTLRVRPMCADIVIKCLRDISKSVLAYPYLREAVSFSLPWNLIPILLKAPSHKKLLRLKAKMLRFIAQLEHETRGDFLASEVFYTYEQELAKTMGGKETARYYRLKFERQLRILEKTKPTATK